MDGKGCGGLDFGFWVFVVEFSHVSCSFLTLRFFLFFFICMSHLWLNGVMVSPDWASF